jgi:hypothetical protein
MKRLFLYFLRSIFMATLFGVQQANALCMTPTEEGIWYNINANTRSITRADVRFVCQDVRYNNQPFGPSYYVRLFGSCTPYDCDWGERAAKWTTDGWMRASFKFSFKTSSVWIKTYRYYGRDYLRVYVWNDFIDGRADYATDEWFLKH